MPSWVSTLLLPLSWLYGGAVRLRAAAYRGGLLPPRRLDGVVISVGNLTVGGTGKTPMVIYLAQGLHARNRRVGVLLRGYRGRRVAELPAIAGAQPPARGREKLWSDEAWLLSRKLAGVAQLGVGSDRYARGRQLAERGAEWFVLDDGFQHLPLARDVDIVLVDSTDPFGNGRLLPAGRLREPLSALWRADLIVLTRSAQNPELEALIRRHSAAPIFHARTELESILPGERSRVPGEPGAWLGKRVFLFCAIGNPAAFFADAGRWGMEVVGQMAFPDHHHFTPRDAARIEAAALACGTEALLYTEKDLFNLRDVRFEHLPDYVCAIRMVLLEEERFWQALEEVLQARGAGESP